MPIIPGVQVSVVKEVVPPQLAPTGILGLVGLTEKIPEGGVGRASSWNRFVELFGPGSAFSVPEARQALQNGASEVVVAALPAGKGAAATVKLKTGAKDALIRTARAPGTWANGLGVQVTRRTQGGQVVGLDLKLQRPDGAWEEFRNLAVAKTAPSNVAVALANGSAVATGVQALEDWPDEGTATFAGGTDATRADYAAGLDVLKNHPDVDLVIAALQDRTAAANVTAVYSDVIAHCNLMSADCRGRLGFGQLPAGTTAAKVAEFAVPLVSDRFVLVAPEGVLGAVAGMIGSLPYFQSPTFKAIAGVGAVTSLIVEDQRELLKAFTVPVAPLSGRGLVVVRGLTTDGDQISVRRVADRAVRSVRAIGEQFIGRLNNADGRAALKSKITESLLQMQKDGALVPSTDGKDPAFKIDVYSSQADFATGTVRVDIAVRPVRAIDYIIATILVQV